jgi:hypothetical protein
LKDTGTFDNVSLSSAPGGVANWTLSSNELNANGCGGGAQVGGLALMGAMARRREGKKPGRE